MQTLDDKSMDTGSVDRNDRERKINMDQCIVNRNSVKRNPVLKAEQREKAWSRQKKHKV